MVGKAQWQEFEAPGHIISAASKQNTVNSCAWLALLFFSPRTLSIGILSPIFIESSQLNLMNQDNPSHTPRYLFPW